MSPAPAVRCSSCRQTFHGRGLRCPIDGQLLLEQAKDVLRRGGLSFTHVLRVLEGTISVLRPMHRRGEHHGAISDETVFFRFDAGEGVVDLASPDQPQSVPAAYASPEHLRHEDLDARADIYGLGVFILHLVGGRPPFVGPPNEVEARHLFEEAPLFSVWSGLDVPAWFDALVASMLAKVPRERPRSVEEVWSALLEMNAEATLAGNEPRQAADPDSDRAGLGDDTDGIEVEVDEDTTRLDLPPPSARTGRDLSSPAGLVPVSMRGPPSSRGVLTPWDALPEPDRTRVRFDDDVAPTIHDLSVPGSSVRRPVLGDHAVDPYDDTVIRLFGTTHREGHPSRAGSLASHSGPAAHGPSGGSVAHSEYESEPVDESESEFKSEAAFESESESELGSESEFESPVDGPWDDALHPESEALLNSGSQPLLDSESVWRCESRSESNPRPVELDLNRVAIMPRSHGRTGERRTSPRPLTPLLHSPGGVRFDDDDVPTELPSTHLRLSALSLGGRTIERAVDSEPSRVRLGGAIAIGAACLIVMIGLIIVMFGGW